MTISAVTMIYIHHIERLPYLAERGVLSVEELLSVLFLSPGVEVFLGTPDPKPTGVGLRPRAPDLMLEVLLTPDPLLPSSSELRDIFDP